MNDSTKQHPISPGPWSFDIDTLGCRQIVDGNGEEVAYTPGLANDDQDRANAQFICDARDAMEEFVVRVEAGVPTIMHTRDRFKRLLGLE